MSDRWVFSVGDLVRLKSGGPIMTVWDIESVEQGIVRTAWFVGEEIKRDGFGKDELFRVTLDPYSHPSVNEWTLAKAD